MTSSQLTSSIVRSDSRSRSLTSITWACFTESKAFRVPNGDSATPTGQFDVLQIKNGAIHIRDHKPGARHEQSTAQLLAYALALSRRTGLRLYDFTCAWFDEYDYFEFYPLQVVHKRKQRWNGAKH